MRGQPSPKRPAVTSLPNLRAQHDAAALQRLNTQLTQTQAQLQGLGLALRGQGEMLAEYRDQLAELRAHERELIALVQKSFEQTLAHHRDQMSYLERRIEAMEPTRANE